MDSLDRQLLHDLRAWLQDGHRARLYTVVQTWGSAPRAPGAMLAVRDDGVLAGSVSGGCVEDDLAGARRLQAAWDGPPAVLTYGVDREHAARFGLPCGGVLKLVEETVRSAEWISEALQHLAQRRPVRRLLDLATGAVRLEPADGQTPDLVFDAQHLALVLGPRWRLLLIGRGPLTQAVIPIALQLDFQVLVCDPRSEYSLPPPLAQAITPLEGMPDDAVTALRPDPRTAIVALTHDPKLDDLALLEALLSPAFYVGALGSERHQATRRERLAAHFDIPQQALDRLHGPVGLRLGGKSPAEIAVAIMAEIVQCRIRLRQPPSVDSDAPVSSALPRETACASPLDSRGR